MESSISAKLEKIQNKYKKFVDIGSYPFFRLGKIGVSIVFRSSIITLINKAQKDLRDYTKKEK